MGTQLMKLNEITNKIFGVKYILRMFQNNVKKSPYRKMGHSHES